MSNNNISVSTEDHVIISIKGPDSSRKFCHRMRATDGTFEPDCGAAIETPVIVRLDDIPTSDKGIIDLARQYDRCSRCDWS